MINNHMTIKHFKLPVRFPLGKIVETRGARVLVDANKKKMRDFVERHANGDWGDVSEEDAAWNNAAMDTGGSLLSSYDVDGERLMVFTEGNRTATTIFRAGGEVALHLLQKHHERTPS